MIRHSFGPSDKGRQLTLADLASSDGTDIRIMLPKPIHIWLLPPPKLSKAMLRSDLGAIGMRPQRQILQWAQPHTFATVPEAQHTLVVNRLGLSQINPILRCLCQRFATMRSAQEITLKGHI